MPWVVMATVLALVDASCKSSSHGSVARTPHPKASFPPYRIPTGLRAFTDSYEILRARGHLIWVDHFSRQPGAPPPGSRRPRAQLVWHSRDGRRWTAAGSAGFEHLADLGFLTTGVVGKQVFLVGEVTRRPSPLHYVVVSRSDDGGATWHASNLGTSRYGDGRPRIVLGIRDRLVLLGAVRFTGPGIGPTDPLRIGAWLSSDHGKTWRLLPASTFGPGDDAPVATGRTADGKLLVTGQSGQAWTSPDGESWATVPLPKAGGDFRITSLGGAALAAVDGDTGRKKYFSTDAGLTWQPLRLAPVPYGDLPTKSGAARPGRLGRTGSTLWMEAFNDGSSDATSAALERSDDGGKTWHDTGLPRHLCAKSTTRPNMDIQPPADLDGALVVAASCGDLVYPGPAAVYVSTDGGHRWKTIRLPRPLPRALLGPARVHGHSVSYDVETETTEGRTVEQLGELVIRT